MNEQIAKRLGWYGRNNVGEWYTLPDRRRLDAPPPFHLDTNEMRNVWYCMGGVLDTLRDNGELEAFTAALRSRAMLAKKTKKIMSVVEFGEFCLTADPSELSAAFGEMIREEGSVEED